MRLYFLMFIIAVCFLFLLMKNILRMHSEMGRSFKFCGEKNVFCHYYVQLYKKLKINWSGIGVVRPCLIVMGCWPKNLEGKNQGSLISRHVLAVEQKRPLNSYKPVTPNRRVRPKSGFWNRCCSVKCSVIRLRTADIFPVVASLKLETKAEKTGCSPRLFTNYSHSRATSSPSLNFRVDSSSRNARWDRFSHVTSSEGIAMLNLQSVRGD